MTNNELHDLAEEYSINYANSKETLIGRKVDDETLVFADYSYAHIKNEIFKIGERNYIVLNKLFGKNSILLASEDIGGTESRTVHLDLSTGRTIITSNGKKWEL